MASLPLFHQRGISMICSDTGNDVAPSPYQRLSNPIHQVGIVAMGLWILDNANLEELAEAAHQPRHGEASDNRGENANVAKRIHLGFDYGEA